MMNTFFLCRSDLANQSPEGGASGGLAAAQFKNIQNRIQTDFAVTLVSMVREITERMLHYRYWVVKYAIFPRPD